jgi:hypothetical protein
MSQATQPDRERQLSVAEAFAAKHKVSFVDAYKFLYETPASVSARESQAHLAQEYAIVYGVDFCTAVKALGGLYPAPPASAATAPAPPQLPPQQAPKVSAPVHATAPPAPAVRASERRVMTGRSGELQRAEEHAIAHRMSIENAIKALGFAPLPAVARTDSRFATQRAEHAKEFAASRSIDVALAKVVLGYAG